MVITGIVVILSLYYLKNELMIRSSELSLELIRPLIDRSFLTSIIVLMVPVNWGLEIYKWKLALKDVEGQSWLNATKSVLCGVTFSIITPNGIGDYGGRLLGISTENRSNALFYNGFLSMSQLLITILVGLSSLIFLGYKLNDIFSILAVRWSLVILNITCLVLFLRVKLKSKKLNKIVKNFNVTLIQAIPVQFRLKVMAISFCRYLVFCFQYYLLLVVFNLGGNVISIFGCIAMVYLIAAVVPSGWFSGLIVRSSVSYFVFESVLSAGEMAVVASSILWLINLLFPALVGLYFSKEMNWMKQPKSTIA